MGVTEYAFNLITDSCCDLPRALVEAHGIEVLPFPFALDGVQHLDELGDSLSHAAFFDAMRAGAHPTTAQVPMVEYLEAFRAAAASGRPTVMLSFGSALSGTFESALFALNAVRSEFPEAELEVVDGRCASIAQGLLVLEVARRRESGVSAADIVTWIVSNRTRVNGYFTLETLEHLRRGGRISDVAAAAGAMLDVRPVLRFDTAGALVIDKVARGRKKSMRSLADAFAERADASAEATVAIGHAGCESDARVLEAMLRERADIGEVLHLEIGPVIGAHTGPGMVACAFWGRERGA